MPHLRWTSILLSLGVLLILSMGAAILLLLLWTRRLFELFELFLDFREDGIKCPLARFCEFIELLLEVSIAAWLCLCLRRPCACVVGRRLLSSLRDLLLLLLDTPSR